MSSVKNLLPTKRRLTILIGFFLLLAIFFSLFQFYYVPNNRDRLHQYGFMLLNRMKVNIMERDKDLKKYYGNTFRSVEELEIDSIRKVLDNKKFRDRIVLNPSMDACNTTNGLKGDGVDPCGQFGFAKGQDEWLRIYNFCRPNLNDTVGFAQTARKFFESAFSYRKELFESYLVINHCTDKVLVLYHDETLGIGENIQQDSALMQSVKSKNSQIFDITIKGVDYKMYTYPFEMGSQHLVLCGIVKTSQYTSSIRNIPTGLIYPLLILALILVVALPFVKPYLLSPQEKLNIQDLYFMSFGLFAGLTLITLLVIQSLILGANAKRENKNLSNLSTRLEDAFFNDIKEASRQLDYFDSVLCSQPAVRDTDSGKWIHLFVNQQSDVLPYGNGKLNFKVPIGDSAHISPYNFMLRGSIVNSEGMQTVRLQPDSASALQMIDVKERAYYRLLKEKKGFLLPGSNRRTFVIDPVISWSVGEYQINFAQENIHCNSEDVSYMVLSSNFPSMVETVFPAGYGYCLIDAQGNVLTHSDKGRSLRENFLDETGRNRTLTEAINSRQEVYMNRIMFYGKPFALEIKPVNDLPFFLVVFHNKNYQIPINLRILSFALLCLFTFNIIAFITLFIFRRVFKLKLRYSIFRPAIEYREWLLPSTKRVNYYVVASWLTIIYILFYLVFCIFLKRFKTDEYVSLIIMLITPINILTSLFLLEKLLVGEFKEARRKEFNRGILIFLVILPFIIALAGFENFKQVLQFVIFEGTWILLTFAQSILYRKDRLKLVRGYNFTEPGKIYLGWYSRFVVAVMFSLTVLPACIFTWFAHNYEIRQSVKKQQLSLAASLSQRRGYLERYFRSYDASQISDSFAKKAQYETGVYTLFNDEIVESMGRLETRREIDQFIGKSFYDSPALERMKLNGKDCRFSCIDRTELLYLNLADQLSPNYRDPSLYPALMNYASDSSWLWFNHRDHIYFYKKNPYTIPWPGENDQAYGLVIQSAIPQRFVLLNSLKYLVLIILITWGLIRFLLWLIRKTSATIFVPIHQASSSNICSEKSDQFNPLNAEDEQKEIRQISPDNLFVQVEKLEAQIGGKSFVVKDSQYINLKYDSRKTDADLLNLLDQNRDVFSVLWEKLNEKQRILLFDMAQDGLVNYRNTKEVSDLCRKGILVFSDNRMQLFSRTFGYYLRTEKMEEKKVLDEKFHQEGSWASFKTPIMVIILSVAIFIFATQQDVWNKVIGLVASLSAILTLLQRVAFSKGSAKE